MFDTFDAVLGRLVRIVVTVIVLIVIADLVVRHINWG